MTFKILGLILFVLSVPSHAMEYATVIDVVEISETRTSPHQVCENVSVPIYGKGPSRGGAIGSAVDSVFGSTKGLVGAIVGGVAGNQVGGGSGKKLATVAGTAIGAQVGDRYSNKELQIIGYENQYKCDEVSKTETIKSGYHVIYDYKGQRLSKVVRYRPVIGSKHPIDITVR